MVNHVVRMGKWTTRSRKPSKPNFLPTSSFSLTWLIVLLFSLSSVLKIAFRWLGLHIPFLPLNSIILYANVRSILNSLPTNDCMRVVHGCATAVGKGKNHIGDCELVCIYSPPKNIMCPDDILGCIWYMNIHCSDIINIESIVITEPQIQCTSPSFAAFAYPFPSGSRNPHHHQQHFHRVWLHWAVAFSSSLSLSPIPQKQPALYTINTNNQSSRGSNERVLNW